MSICAILSREQMEALGLDQLDIRRDQDRVRVEAF